MFTAIGVLSPGRHQRAGVTRDLSRSGVLFHSTGRFQLGQRVRLQLRPAGQVRETEVEGTVVRIATDAPLGGTAFPHVTAVQFDTPVPLPPA